jgi:hypothetical protein
MRPETLATRSNVKIYHIVGFLLALAFAPAAADASTFLVGAGAGGSNCFPFGCEPIRGGDGVYQQVYAASDFTGPLSIAGLTFYNSNHPGGSLNAGTFTVSLSTTTAPVDGLNTSNFAANIGADDTVVFSGTLPTLTPGGSFTLPFDQQFAYDPLQGNLLINITSSDVNYSAVFLNAYDGNADGLFSRATNYGTGYAGYGLETGFVIGDDPGPKIQLLNILTGVPEPATWAMMLAGFGAVGGLLRARRRLAFSPADPLRA